MGDVVHLGPVTDMPDQLTAAEEAAVEAVRMILAKSTASTYAPDRQVLVCRRVDSWQSGIRRELVAEITTSFMLVVTDRRTGEIVYSGPMAWAVDLFDAFCHRRDQRTAAARAALFPKG